MTVLAYRHESKWARRRRIRRMVDKTCMPRTGVVLQDKTWHVYLMTGALALTNVALFVRLWL